jgi:Tol biopolymer transport system component
MRTHIPVLALLASLLFLPGCGGGSGSGSSDGSAQGRIVFNRGSDIWIMNPDGTDQHSILREGSGPVWSPDGRRIAYTNTLNGVNAISVMNADGSNSKQIAAPNSSLSHVAWSPDGNEIAFAKDGGIWQMTASGANPHKLIDNAYFPSWSPDGTKLAFISSSTQTLNVTTLDGSAPKQLTTFQVYDFAWSPSGTRIAFDRGNDRWTMNADGSNLQDLSNDNPNLPDFHNGDSPLFGPSWSPDGSKIVFTAAGAPIGRPPPLATYLFVMNADGTNIKQLTTSGFSGAPDWGPDR